MTYSSSSLTAFYNLNAKNLTTAYKKILSSTLSTIGDFESLYKTTVADMTIDQFRHIQEGWFHMSEVKNENRRLRCALEYLLWYSQNIGDVKDLDEKIDFFNDTDSYYKYQNSHYWGLFLKDFDTLYSVANQSYVEKVPESRRSTITADLIVVAMILCYSSGLWLETVNIKESDFSSDFSKFVYNGKTYDIDDRGIEYLKIYNQQKNIIANGNKTYMKSDSEYFIKYVLPESKVNEKSGQKYNNVYYCTKLLRLSNQYHKMYPHMNPNINFTDESINMSGYFYRACQNIEKNQSFSPNNPKEYDMAWEKYILAHPFMKYSIPQMMAYRDIYLSQTI